MREYEIKMLDHIPCEMCWKKIPTAPIDTCVWGDAYRPVCYAQVVYVRGVGFIARLTCEEKNPKAVHTGFFSDVYKDSCLEMFAIWDDDSDKYINIEMNACGASLIAIGSNRYERTPIDRLIEKPFPVTAEILDDKWRVTVMIPEGDLEQIYGMSREKFVPGYTIRGNFYKCGDETEIEHYIMWNPVETPSPDYHRPEYFAKMILTE